MASFAVVGAGQAGLYLATGLLREGHDVTLFSAVGPRETLERSVASTAFLYDEALDFERELGIEIAQAEAPAIEGIHLELCLDPERPSLTLHGRFRRPGQAIDHRLKCARWMESFVRDGGKLVIGKVAAEDLHGLALRHDLVAVATGKGSLSGVFPLDEERSRYDRPRRQLALLTLRGLTTWPDLPFAAVRVTFVESLGEIFWVPFYDRSGQPATNLLIEAEPGGPMDRFPTGIRPREALETAHRLVAEFAPGLETVLEGRELVDPEALLTGAVTPVVRRPAARLPGGGSLLALGDAAVLNDPISGQGANSAARHARFLLEAIRRRLPEPLDQGWMEETFEEYWGSSISAVVNFSNALLGSPSPSPPPPGPDQAALVRFALKGQVLARLVAESCGSTPDEVRSWP